MPRAERVQIISGKKPIIIVVSHDSDNMCYMGQIIARNIDGYAVLNRGWKYEKAVDVKKSEADCNNLLHCMKQVVKDEFLDPIVGFKNRIMKDNLFAYVFHLHAISDHHRRICGDHDMAFVIGHGSGHPDSHSCDSWRKNLFAYNLSANLNGKDWEIYEAKKGNKMGGWDKICLNQYFRQWNLDYDVHSIQFSVIQELCHWCPENISDIISKSIQEMIDYDDPFNAPSLTYLKQY